MDEHKSSIEDIYKGLDASQYGLTSDEAGKRLTRYGANLLQTKKRFSTITLFLKQFTNFFALLLIFGSALAFFADYLSPGEGNLYIGIALIAVVFLNSIFTFIQQFQSERIMESFSRMLPKEINVLRDNVIQRISSEYVVPGDILCLSEGDKIPADGRLIEQHALKVDLSSITGESEPQLRKLECTSDYILESRNMVFSGTFVQSGNGKAVVYGTGMDTQIGNIVRLTKDTGSVQTPLHKELSRFIRIISAIAFFLGIFFFTLSFYIGHRLMGSLVFAIGIIVANVPEGLLPTVTLCLSIAAKRMARKNALIRNLESVETMGSTTVICTDKTGTITENRMAVNTIFVDQEEYDANEKYLNKAHSLHMLLKTMVLCNNSRLEKQEFKGDPTETSLLYFSKRFMNVQETIEKERRIDENPFDSKTRRMITTNISGDKKTSYIKGAPEVLLKACSHILIKGNILRLDAKKKAMIDKFYKKMASRGERVLALGYRPMKDDKLLQKDFIFIGLAGLMDPPRKEVPFAIQKCRSAGIKIIMITGDHSLTAEAIARRVGLVDDDSANIMTGAELNSMDDSSLKESLKKDNVIFARTSPSQKLRIVQTLQSMGEVVTVTGDGVNDAPALKNADMGVSMGLSGTEVAREASDMVIMDDNFATIVDAIEEGRTIFDNIKKFIAYILTSNVPEILPFIAFVLLKIPLPLTVVLILAIDLGTDLLPAIGLGTERPETDVMKKKPRSRDEKLMTNNLLFMSYGIVGMLQAAAGFFSYFFILYSGGWTFGQELGYTDPLYMKAVTGFFASIIICQIADVLICRTRRQSVFSSGFFKNRVILMGIMVELLLLAAIMYIPAANVFFDTHPLSLFELSLSIPFALTILLGDELRKFLIRRENRFLERYLNW